MKALQQEIDFIYLLHSILKTSQSYCIKFHVSLATEKTKLMAFYTKKHTPYVNYLSQLDLISLNDTQLKFNSTADHVGILRSNLGNLPHIEDRIAARKKSLFAVLPAGLARKHNGNIAAALHVDRVFSVPILLSGLNALVLSKKKYDILNFSNRNTYQ